MYARLYACFLTFCALSFSSTISAAPKGKIDAGPAYLEADIKANGATVKTMEMYAFSVNGTILFMHDLCLGTNLFDGVCLKPKLTVASGEGELWNAGIGLGYYLPVTDWLTVIPNGGITFGELETKTDIPPFGLFNINQTFQSKSPYVGVDVSLTFGSWLVTGVYQYAWSNTRTITGSVARTRTESTGSNYALQIDYYITDCWSVNAGLAHNLARDKERNGIEITGGRLGVGYTF